MRYENLINRRFEMLRAVERAPGGSSQKKSSYAQWICQCDCGRTITVSSRQLKRGTVTNCGCIPKKNAKNGSIAEDLTGRTFGQLEVLYRDENKGGRPCWVCRCVCKKLHSAIAGDLRDGNVTSCGCKRQKIQGMISARPHHINGTTIERLLLRKPRSDNQVQTVGVRQCGEHAFEAVIGLCGEHYWLGRFKTLEEAARMRKQAENQLHWPVVEAYQRWSAYEKNHSGWAEEHPLRFTVHRLSRTTFKVQFYGLPEEDALANMRQSTDKPWKEITAAQMDTPAPQQ